MRLRPVRGTQSLEFCRVHCLVPIVEGVAFPVDVNKIFARPLRRRSAMTTISSSSFSRKITLRPNFNAAMPDYGVGGRGFAPPCGHHQEGATVRQHESIYSALIRQEHT